MIQQCLNGITLDPCSDNGKHIESCQHLTAADDGLSQKWFGRVFMNPPYSCPGVWIAKLQEEFDSGRVEEAIALMPAATDTKWFHPLISSNLICFWKGRIKFLDVNYQPKMPARQSHCLIYWGKNQPRFKEIFSGYQSRTSSSAWRIANGQILLGRSTNHFSRGIRSAARAQKAFHRCLLRQQTYAKGSTGCRPAGQTRLEQSLRKFITKGDKLNSCVPGWMMGFPVGWVESTLMDTGETISVQLPFIPEYATTSTNAENVTTSTPDQSAPSKQRSQLSGSVTSPRSQVLRANAQPETHIIDQYKSHSAESLASIQSAANPTPEFFLEETKPQREAVQKPKGRQRKGCLYKYIENKKLKGGAIASYPRVIGHRDPNNPTHWRWGFNWEEKVDGEWKNRSLSVKLGAIPLIQSMQRESVPLGEIIGFIQRSKYKPQKT